MRPSAPVYVAGICVPLGALEPMNGCGAFGTDNVLFVEEPKAPVDAACWLCSVDEELGPVIEENRSPGLVEELNTSSSGDGCC